MRYNVITRDTGHYNWSNRLLCKASVKSCLHSYEFVANRPYLVTDLSNAIVTRHLGYRLELRVYLFSHVFPNCSGGRYVTFCHAVAISYLNFYLVFGDKLYAKTQLRKVQSGLWCICIYLEMHFVRDANDTTTKVFFLTWKLHGLFLRRICPHLLEKSDTRGLTVSEKWKWIPRYLKQAYRLQLVNPWQLNSE